MKLRGRAAALALLLLSGPALAAAAAERAASDPALLQVELARALRQVGNERGAGSALDRALEIDPGCGVAWLERGLLEESSSSSYFAQTRARRAFARAFELDPSLADPLRHPEIRASRAALAAQIDGWRRLERAGTEAQPAFVAVAAPAPLFAHPHAASPATARAAQVLAAGDLTASGPVNQVLPAGSVAASRGATSRRGVRGQRFRPPAPVEEPEPEAIIENQDQPPPEEEAEPASDEPTGETSSDTESEEPPPGLY